MPRHKLIPWVLPLLLSVAIAAGGRAADVLDNVPPDALGLLVVRDLQAVDAKIRESKLVPASLNGPLALLQLVLGPNNGIDPRGDYLLAVLSSDESLEKSPLCVWLPIGDYDRFARALGGDPRQRITVITVMGEDVLCAQHGKWALVMDADQRQRMDHMLAGESTPPRQIAAWREWLKGNAVAAVVLPTPASRKALREWAGDTPVGPLRESPAGAAPGQLFPLDDLFPPAANEPAREGLLPLLRRAVQSFLSDSPKLARLALDADAVAIGVRIDGADNAWAGLRMAWPRPAAETAEDTPWRRIDQAGRAELPSLHANAEFSISGAGSWPREVAIAAMETAVRKEVADLRSDPTRPTLDAASIRRFSQASEQVAVDVQAANVFHALGGDRDGVYSNKYLAVRVASADLFVAHFADLIRSWNELHQKAQPSDNLAFDSQQVEIGGRAATQYSLDIAASLGLADNPDSRQSMERLFGPDRKMQLFVVPVDPQTVMLTEGPAEQAAAVLKLMPAQKATNWDAANIAETNRLLPNKSDWRLFVSPSGYTKWRKREMLALLGDAIGAPVIAEFPATPPIGLSGGFPDGELWIDAVIPAQTLRAASPFLLK
ncbi:MAG: hypothetical protein WD669_08715 [Pirellulales bacterium]